MPIQDQNPNVKKRFDLEERTAKFGEEIRKWSDNINKNTAQRRNIGKHFNPTIYKSSGRRQNETKLY